MECKCICFVLTTMSLLINSNFLLPFLNNAEILHQIRSIVTVIWHGFRTGYGNVDWTVRRLDVRLRQRYEILRSRICHTMNSNAPAMMRDVWVKDTVHRCVHVPVRLFDVREINWKKFHAAFQLKRRNCIWNRMRFQWFITTG